MAATTTPNATKIPNKSEFIRNQPSTLSAAEVVEKAKAEGVTIDPGLVYNIRGRAKSKGRVKKSTPTATKATSKAAFVRQFPNLSPKDVVLRGKAEGLHFEVGYVYNVRSSVNAAKTKSSARKTAAKPLRTTDRRPPTAGSTGAEDLLRAIAAEIGLGRAVEILTGQRERLRSLIG
ncbi:MAG: hypothetical protein ABSC94_24985 [Polyangiaceae bacterium]|jgi:hypothetical protein